MIKGVFVKFSRSSKLVQNLISHVRFSPDLKPDFCDSHLSPVTSKIFRFGHVQYGETNEIYSSQFAFEVQIFQHLRNFFCSETRQTSFLNDVDFHDDQQIFTKWLP